MEPICAEWEERLSLYVDGLLNPFDEQAVEAHLSRCEACRTAVALWREVGQSIRRLPRELPPADLRTRIFARTTRKPNLLQRLRLGWWQLAPALGMGLLLAWWTLPRSPLGSAPMANQPALSSEPAPATPSDLVVPLESSGILPTEARPADSEPRVVFVIQPAPAPRWREPSPRWILSTRAPAPTPPTPVNDAAPPTSTQEIVLAIPSSSTPPPLTEIADLPVQNNEASEGIVPDRTERPTSGTDAPAKTESVALVRWSEQFNQELQQENRPRLPQAVRSPRDSRFFVPILSWNIK
ncbi:MAG: zf-HC2 domain-containing protein [Armatimonadota bacterium]